MSKYRVLSMRRNNTSNINFNYRIARATYALEIWFVSGTKLQMPCIMWTNNNNNNNNVVAAAAAFSATFFS